MRGIGNCVRAVAGVVALLIVVPPSAEAVAQQKQPAKQTLKQPQPSRSRHQPQTRSRIALSCR